MAIKGNIPDIGKAYILKVGKDLEAEVENRKAGDDALRKAIEAEQKTRKEADDELRKAIEAEQKAREAADGLLRDDLGDISDRVGTVEGSVTNIDNRVTIIENNMTGTAIDATLTKEGEAADAKAVGDRLKALESGSGGGSVAVDATLTKEGEAADAKAVGEALKELSGKALDAQNTAGEAAADAEEANNKITNIQMSALMASMLPAPWVVGGEGPKDTKVIFRASDVTFASSSDTAYLYYFDTKNFADGNVELVKVDIFSDNPGVNLSGSAMVLRSASGTNEGSTNSFRIYPSPTISRSDPVGLYWDHKTCKFHAHALASNSDLNNYKSNSSEVLLHVFVPDHPSVDGLNIVTTGAWDLMYAQNLLNKTGG
ncbi:MAG: hypothetical protein J1F63_08375 [Oscillospiraceae bacterium]|nr:hypothetical protein [Oscillospiraceae bacterium]